MCIRDSLETMVGVEHESVDAYAFACTTHHFAQGGLDGFTHRRVVEEPVSYTHLRAHETVLDIVCRLLLEKKNKNKKNKKKKI